MQPNKAGAMATREQLHAANLANELIENLSLKKR